MHKTFVNASLKSLRTNKTCSAHLASTGRASSRHELATVTIQRLQTNEQTNQNQPSPPLCLEGQTRISTEEKCEKMCTNSSKKTRQSIHHHYHHHHLSFNREGRWGTTDDFTISFLQFSLFSTALWDLANSGPVHSLMLSFHFFFCLPCLLPHFTVPCKMVLSTPDERET